MKIQKKTIGLLVHRKLASALKLNTYFRKGLNNNEAVFEIPGSIIINDESYLLYFLNPKEEIKGGIFLKNEISSDENIIINIDSTIVAPYLSNDKYCSTIGTFNNVNKDKNFMYFSPSNLNYFRIRSNEIQDISIFISDKNYNQVQLLRDIPTFVKLIIKSQFSMDFTSNLRVSNRAPKVSNFQNQNSFFRVHIPS